MIYPKSCPRCNGDMHLESDRHGSFKTCIQCGHIVEEDCTPLDLKPPDSRGRVMRRREGKHYGPRH